MMTDPLTWSPINLGRWSGTQVRVHIFLIVFVVLRLLNAAMAPDHTFVPTACWLGLLILALAVHELGHALMAKWLGCDRDEVRL
jgi:stage IV sporulation protein FB